MIEEILAISGCVEFVENIDGMSGDTLMGAFSPEALPGRSRFFLSLLCSKISKARKNVT